MLSVSQGISASYSCMPNCGAHGPQYLIDGNTNVLIGGYETMHTREQWCGASGGCNAWNTNLDGSTVDNTLVASLGYVSNGYTNVNGLSAGSTYWWWTYWYGFEYDDGFDCRYEQDEYTGSEPADVTSPVTFIDVSEVGTTNSAEFFGGIRFASLNISSCGGERFGIKIRFSLDANTTISNFNSSVSSDGQFALTNNPVDDCSVCYYGNDNPPYTITYLRKMRSSGSRAVTHTLQGTSNGRQFTANATVTLVCQ